MLLKTNEQLRIDRAINKLREWYWVNYPICVLCGHNVYHKPWDMVHKIRRSYRSSIYTRYELQTMKLNVGPGHRECHTIFDTKPKEAVLLPMFNKVMEDIKTIDIDYFRYTMQNQYNGLLELDNDSIALVQPVQSLPLLQG